MNDSDIEAELYAYARRVAGDIRMKILEIARRPGKTFCPTFTSDGGCSLLPVRVSGALAGGSTEPLQALPDPITPDYHGPQDMMNPGYPAHKRVWDVTGDLLNGRVTNSEARAGLRKALDKADAVKPPAGDALGRATKG